MALRYCPPVYMWIVTFNDGKALSQFDPETGKQNRFPFPDQSRITKFGWYPIMPHMVAKILEGEGVVTIPTEYPIYEINIKPGQLPYMRSTTRLPSGQYHKCLECNTEWIFSSGQPDPNVVRQGYPWASNHKVYCVTCASQGDNTELEREGEKWSCPNQDKHRGPKKPLRRYQVSVCPSCGYHNLPTDRKEERRIIQMVKDMSYLVYKLGVKKDPLDGGPVYFMINQWGEVIEQ